MRKMLGFFPLFKAFMAIVYLLLGAGILFFPTSLLPVNNSFRIALGILLLIYGIVRIYSSYTAYVSYKEDKNEKV
jgi:cytochrome c biogenesis protein CcdA